MDKKQIGLKLALDAVGLPANMDRFSDRLILQKSVCLIQAIGVNLGYRFGWYVRGPYSPSLADDGFAVVEAADNDLDDSDQWQLDSRSQERLRSIRSLFESQNRDELAHKLERLASLVYLKGHGRLDPNNCPDATKDLAKLGKEYSVAEVSDGFAELDKYGFIEQSA